MMGAKTSENGWTGPRLPPPFVVIRMAALTASTTDVLPTPIVVSGGSKPPPSLVFRPLKLCRTLMLGTTRSCSVSSRSRQMGFFRRFAGCGLSRRELAARRNIVRHQGQAW